MSAIGERARNSRHTPAGEPAATTADRSAPSDDAGATPDHRSAGDLGAATERLLDAAALAADLGLPAQAVAFSREALGHLEHLPASPERRLLELRLMIDLARFQWAAAGPGPDFTLAGALATARRAAALAAASAPAAVRLEAVTLLGRILLDVGDPASLADALAVLTEGARCQEASGDVIGAASLLNDQAAVWLRIGDPLRARRLLEASLRVFERPAAHDPRARRELAETRHLLARLPLHVEARCSRDEDAVAQGVEDALRAARAYDALRMPRELARVWETLGRLELRRGRTIRADAWLHQAFAAQRELGDALGQAATAEALARRLAGAGRYFEAVELLAESLALNRAKGSLRGLDHLLRAVGDLEAAAAGVPGTSPALEAALDALRARIAAARDRLATPPCAPPRDEPRGAPAP